MPIRMMCVKRHHVGKPDYWAPAVICDACGDRIDRAEDGNYYWKPDYDQGKEAFYQSVIPLLFGHKKCNHSFDAVAYCYGELSWLPGFLTANLGKGIGSYPRQLS